MRVVGRLATVLGVIAVAAGLSGAAGATSKAPAVVASAGDQLYTFTYRGSGAGTIVQHVDNRPGHGGSAFDDTYEKQVKWSISWPVTTNGDQIVKIGDPSAEISGKGSARINSSGSPSCGGPVALPKVGIPGKPFIPEELEIVGSTPTSVTVRLDGPEAYGALPLYWADIPGCPSAVLTSVSPEVAGTPAARAWGASWGTPTFKITFSNGHPIQVAPPEISTRFPFAPVDIQKKVIFDFSGRLTIKGPLGPGEPTTSTVATTTPKPAPPPPKPTKSNCRKAASAPAGFSEEFKNLCNALAWLEKLRWQKLIDDLSNLISQRGGGGDVPIPVEDEKWPDAGTLLDQVCIVPDPKNPTGPCPTADDLASGSLAVAPAPSSQSTGTLLLKLTPAGQRALALGKPIEVVNRVTIRFVSGASGTGTRVVTIKPTASAASAPVIASVLVSGTPQSPTIVVRGRNLGKLPPPNPSASPSNQTLCPVTIKGNAGLDYGTSLYVADDAQSFAAGRFRPSINELDCVGLIVTKFTPTEVDLRFGGFYAQAYPKYALRAGDSVQIAVNGATITVHARYGTTVSS